MVNFQGASGDYSAHSLCPPGPPRVAKSIGEAVDVYPNPKLPPPAQVASGAARIAQGVLATASRLLAVAGVLSRPNLGRETSQVPALHQGGEMVK
jgi:hypothetical protein